MAISPIAARHHGAGDEALIGRYTRQGIYLGVAIAAPIMIIAQLYAGPIMEALKIDIAFRDMTASYLQMITLGAPGMFIFLALRFTTEGIGVTKPIMYTSIFALVCNVFLNWVFMFGKLGAPAMGAVGCGLASGITMWMIAGVLALYMMTGKVYEKLHIFSRLAPVRPDVFKEIVWLGVPIAITITAEAGPVQRRVHTDGPAGSADNGCPPDRNQLRGDDVHDPARIELGNHGARRLRARQGRTRLRSFCRRAGNRYLCRVHDVFGNIPAAVSRCGRRSVHERPGRQDYCDQPSC